MTFQSVPSYFPQLFLAKRNCTFAIGQKEEINTGMMTCWELEMATDRAARWPARAGPENSGPRALLAQTGLKFLIYESFVQRKIQIFVDFC